MIGVYVHHDRSHLYRVLPVAAALRDRGEAVTLLVAGPLGDGFRPHGVSVEHLPPGPEGGDLDLGLDLGLGLDLDLPSRRAALGWIERARPEAVWVDGSPAMSLAAHLTGTPVVSTLPPGVRRDEPHVLRCRAADELIGAWPPGMFPDTVAGTGARVREVGGISRFERRGRESGSRCRRRPRVVHLNSAGPRGDHRFWRAVRATARRMGPAEWVELGGPDGQWRKDPWPELSSADVVVTCAGQSSVADAACCDVPMVVVPRRHEYGEHDAVAVALDLLPGVAVMRYGDGPTAVARTVCDQVEAAMARRAHQRTRRDRVGIRTQWGVDGAAGRAAAVIRGATTTREPFTG